MKFKRHKTVDNLLANALPENGKAIDAMNRMFEEDAVCRHLLILRTKASVSQTEMAKRLNVSQSVISKMENNGNYLKLNDVVRYIGALGYAAEFALVNRTFSG